jgi:uncharacterized protein (DUF1800 family)
MATTVKKKKPLKPLKKKPLKPLKKKPLKPLKKKRKPIKKIVRKVKARRRRLTRPPLPAFARRPMSLEQVERLYWRAGFGPSEADRTAWTGKTMEEVVDALLNTPQGPLAGPDPTDGTTPFDPKVEDAHLVMAWVSRMQRSPNPLPERLAFFWHRHWANSRNEVDPPQAMIRQNELFRRYGDLAANPTADFRTMTFEMTEDPAMLRYLNGEYNRKNGINENYAREIMELFCLGVTDAAGNPNYTEDDVKQLARCFTGWRVDDDDPDAVSSYFTPSRFDGGVKTFLGKTGAFNARDAVDVVLSHPNHAPYLIRKLWSEFVAGPPDQATIDDLVATYNASGRQIKPVMRKILTHPQLFDSLGEPTMVKPPIVYAVGALKATGVPIVNRSAYDGLSRMGQLPYFPPNVAGWEYGSAFLSTNTAIERWRFAAGLANRTEIAPQDIPTETPEQAFDRAYLACGKPWLSARTRELILDYSRRAPVNTANRRKARQLMLRSMILGGPDGQVM